MNFRNDWEATIQMANKDLDKYGMTIRILEDPDEGVYSCDIHDGFEWVNFADNYYEHELGELVNDAWTHARAKAASKREQSGACFSYAEREQARPEVKAKAKKREPKPKVWVVTFINDCEWEMPNVSVQVFGSLDAARKCLDEEWQTLTAETEYDEDVSKKGDDDFLFEDHCANRTIGEIKEREIMDE